MTEPVTIVLAGQPKGKERPRFGRGRAYTAPATRAYEEALAWAGRASMGGRPPLTGALRVRVTAFIAIPPSWPKRKQEDARDYLLRPTGKPDCDNILKTLDALNGIVWTDDAQIVEAWIGKIYDPTPRLVISVTEITREGA